MSAITVDIRRLPHGTAFEPPRYATGGAAGMDLVAAVEADIVLAPGARALIATGIAIAVPAGYEAQVRPRSGLALKHGITVLNSPGTIDADYRGEVGVILVNHGAAPFTVSRGSFTVSRGLRVAQLVIAPVSRAVWFEVAELAESGRGGGGFGSTGTTG